MVSRRTRLIVAMNTQTWFPKNMHAQHVLLSLNKVGVEASCASLHELMFDNLAFDAVSTTGTALGGTSGEQAFFV